MIKSKYHSYIKTEEEKYLNYDLSLYSFLPDIENPIYGSQSYEEVKKDSERELEAKLLNLKKNQENQLYQLISDAIKKLNTDISDLNRDICETLDKIKLE